MKEIPLVNSEKVALVDDEDFEKVSKYRWLPRLDGYVRSSSRIKGKQPLLHRFILRPPSGVGTDHINRNKLDNRKENLRCATQSQNNMNSLKYRNGITSQFKGVCWDRATKKWRALIGHESKVTYLGRYKSEEEAAHAYDRAAHKYFGEFARMNYQNA